MGFAGTLVRYAKWKFMNTDFLQRFSKLFVDLHTNEDILTFLVRGHLYCESTLANILRKALTRCEALDVERLDYQAKLKLCNAFGLIPENLVPGLEQLGSLRNKYVHRLDYNATEQDQLDLINTIKSTCGLPSQYYLHRGIQFPNGFKRCIVALWIPLEVQLAPDEESAEELLLSLAALMADVSGLDIDAFIEQMKKAMSDYLKKGAKR